MAIIIDSPYQLIVETGIDMSTATQTRVIYKKPDQTTSYFTATVSGTTLLVDIPGASNDVAGQWKFHSSVTLPGYAAPFLGDVVTLKVMDKYY